MTDPVPPILSVVNDPTYTPLAANKAGDIFVTEDGTVLIVSSTLRARGSHLITKHKWLIPPPSYPKVLR